jgi:hypothetical protein
MRFRGTHLYTDYKAKILKQATSAKTLEVVFFMENGSELLVHALGWLRQGFGVLPVQPGTKQLITGFGVYKSRLTDPDGLRFWFEDRSANIAVICPDDAVVLDFDDSGLYKAWADEHAAAARSYTELTPNDGAHVFIRFHEAVSVCPVKGLEIKRFCLVYPSLVDGLHYQILGGAILTLDLVESLRGVAEVEAVKITGESVAAPTGAPIAKDGLISRVKERWPILSYLAFFAPGTYKTIRGSGRWRSGLCPWHGDTNPSLWIDTERGLWGCHACGAHGDVINWASLQFHKENLEAARYLDSYHVKVE